MIGELQETDWNLPKSLLTAFESHSSKNSVMEARIRETSSSTMRRGTSPVNEGMRREREYQYQQRHRHHQHRSFIPANGKKALRASYFGIESMLLLVCLTASLLILPLILPPLPPPPFLLLLLPIGILGLLLILAFMPSNVRDLTYTYM